MKEQWTELSVIVSQNVAELASNKLIEYGSQGTVFEDVPESAGLNKIIAYYPESSDVDDIRRQLQHYFDELQQLGERVEASEIHAALITNPDWGSSWKEFFKPSRVGERVVIKPSWEIFDAHPSDVVIELDPGMAFGTGLHASTRLAIALLEQYLRADSSVLDVGVGSGILSLVAARLGANYALGVDIDEDAVAIARENVRKNCQLCTGGSELGGCIELKVGSIDTLDISRQFDCILMNIRPNIIVPLLPYAATYLQTGGALIVSGILEEEGPELLHEIRAFNFISHQQLTEDGWIAYVLSQV